MPGTGSDFRCGGAGTGEQSRNELRCILTVATSTGLPTVKLSDDLIGRDERERERTFQIGRKKRERRVERDLCVIIRGIYVFFLIFIGIGTEKKFSLEWVIIFNN